MYQLLDSGEGEKLERFGEITLRRPSTLCIWNRRLDKSVWAKASSTYIPKEGWTKNLESWQVSFGDARLNIRLQNNGQIGVFPEHSTYLPEMLASFSSDAGQPKMLSLFAYTGLATVTALKAGVDVTHVDALKSALDWARENIESSGIKDPKVRLIPEEALTFAKREIKRGKSYDLILADPPSFSRVGKNQEWDLLEVLQEFLQDLLALLSPTGTMYFTSHLTDAGPTIIENILCDLSKGATVEISSRALSIAEHDSPRRLPAGHLVKFTKR